MAIKRPKPEEIVVKLRQVEVLMGQGMLSKERLQTATGPLPIRHLAHLLAQFQVEGPRPFRGSGPSFGADRSAEPAEPDQVFLRSVFT